MPESCNVLGSWSPEAVARLFIVIVNALFGGKGRALVVSVTFVSSRETATAVKRSAGDGIIRQRAGRSRG